MSFTILVAGSQSVAVAVEWTVVSVSVVYWCGGVAARLLTKPIKCNMWLLGWLLLLCSGLSQTQNLDHRFFLVQIIEKYGKNGSITYEGFERLYNNLGLGNASNTQNPKHENIVNPEHSPQEEKTSSLYSRKGRGIDFSLAKDSSEEELTWLVDQHEEATISASPSPEDGVPRCLGPAQLLAVYGVPRSDHGLSPVSFLHLCPAIIYQLDQRSCGWSGSGSFISDDSTIIIPHANWFFALLTILVISVSGLLCVAIVPLLHKAFISQLISFLVALAVGTLLGDAFLHLIPHALEAHDEHHSHRDSLFTTGLMFLTLVFFFTFEAILNIEKDKKVVRNNDQNSTYSPVSVLVHQNGKEMMQIVEDVVRPTQAEGGAHSHSNTAVMVIVGDGLHNLTDGLAVGAAFSGGLAPGFATALAVFTHELPHELGDFAVLLQSGVTVRRALFYNIVSSVLSLFGAIIGLIVGNFGGSTRWIYAITAASFVYIALSNLIPEINRQKSSCRTIFLRLVGILSGGLIMGSIALYEQNIQNLFS